MLEATLVGATFDEPPLVEYKRSIALTSTTTLFEATLFEATLLEATLFEATLFEATF